MLFIAPKQMLMFITVMFLGVVSLTRLCPVCLVKPAGGLKSIHLSWLVLCCSLMFCAQVHMW